jgi:hypothetical protein
MEDGDFTVINLVESFGTAALRSDGRVVWWMAGETEYHLESQPGWFTGALAMGTRWFPELKEALPPKPEGARDCESCKGRGLVARGNPPDGDICFSCWGTGWLPEESNG